MKSFALFCVLSIKYGFMNKYRTILCALLAVVSISAAFADDLPSINPSATYTNKDGMEETGTEYSGSAPLKVLFRANPENATGWSAYYEWRFSKENETEPYMVRYEEDTEYTFTEAGTHTIELNAVFTQGTDTVNCKELYEITPIRITISESKLVMPNAFSPNGDPYNEKYQAKEYQSLVEFHATIYNRWGQKLYEWDDPSEEKGWDGTFHGSPVKDGVYFVHVVAKGADGRHYNIRKDVNLLRGHHEIDSSSSSTTPE